MSFLLELPAQHDDLAEAFHTLLTPALEQRNVRLCGWMVVSGYLQGYRGFRVFDRERGQMVLNYEDEEGQLQLRWDEAKVAIQKEVGRLSLLDVAPVVEKGRFSLESLRNSSMSQVILDNMDRVGTADLKKEFCSGLVNYGTYGIASWDDPAGDTVVSHVKELIPPWELLSVPAMTANPTDQRGIIRSRLVPLAQLQRIKGYKSPGDESRLEVREFSYGHPVSLLHTLHERGEAFTSFSELFDKQKETYGVQSRGGKGKKEKPLKTDEKFVLFRELWGLHPDGWVTRYVGMAGRHIAFDRDLMKLGVRMPFPIGIGRYHNTGHFYGDSFAERIIAFSKEVEYLIARLIEHMEDMDRFGFVMVPNNLGINLNDFYSSNYPRVIGYEPDLTPNPARVEAIQPVTANDVPGRVTQLLVQLQDRLTAQGPIYSGLPAGRGDSGQFLSQLVETGSTHLRPTAEEIDGAYAAMYRHQLYLVRRKIESGSLPETTLDIVRLENGIAGMTMDPSTGKVSLDPEAIPDPWSVRIGIRSRDPNSADRRRQEAMALLDRGRLSFMEFIILNYKENWGYPIGHRAVWENYVKAVFHNQILFNDGVTPGRLPIAGARWTIHPDLDRPEVQLLASDEFTSTAEFSLASTEVIQAFEERARILKGGTAEMLVPQAPTIEGLSQRLAGGGNGMTQGF